MTIFVESSILVEYMKGRNRLFEILTESRLRYPTLRYVYNATVLNEYLFHYLGVEGNKAPLTLKVNKLIPGLLQSNDYAAALRQMTYLSDNINFVEQVPYFMQRYNLLPSDAAILTTCLQYDIQHIATLDADFTVPCETEGLTIVNSEETLRKVLANLP